MAGLLLGYDIGSSSVKAALVDAQTGRLVASATSPDQEMKISSPQPAWGEQHPDDWWQEVIRATQRLNCQPLGCGQRTAKRVCFQPEASDQYSVIER